MPANIDKMFSVREGTWHGLEDRLDDYPSMDQVKAYFGFEVLERPMYVDVDDDADLALIPDWNGLVRNDNGLFLAPSRDSYGIVQPATLVDLTEALVGGADKKYPVRLTTGGSLNEGRVIWTLAEVGREWYVDGDTSPILPYVLLVNSFDGSYALMSRTTGIRVVCQNTLDMSVAQKGGAVFKFKHTANVMDRVDEARRILTGAASAVDAFVEMSNALVKVKVSKAGVAKFLDAFIPMPPDLKKTDALVESIEERRAAVQAILSGSTGTVTSRHSGTAYGLYTAGVEFLDFNRPSRTADSLFQRTMLKQDPAKADLLKLVHLAAKV